ncbi:MAG: hypothetical protein WA908_05595, partial [Pontixanthobacter sp.]
MSMILTVAAISLLQVPNPDADRVDVAYDEMTADQNSAAIRRIEANSQIAVDDPARLINLGIAHAREGRLAEARALFD